MPIRSLGVLLGVSGERWSAAELEEVGDIWLFRRISTLTSWAHVGVRMVVGAGDWPPGLRPRRDEEVAWAEDAALKVFYYLRFGGPKGGRPGLRTYRPTKHPLWGTSADIETVFLTWLRTIMIRAGKRAAHTELRRKRAEASAVETGSGARSECAEHSPDQDVKLLDDPKHNLSQKEREAVQLIALEQLNYPEAAQKSSWPCSALSMKLRYHRGREKLRKSLDELRPHGH